MGGQANGRANYKPWTRDMNFVVEHYNYHDFSSKTLNEWHSRQADDATLN